MFKTYIKIHVSVKTTFKGIANTLFKMVNSLETLQESFKFSIFLCVRIIKGSFNNNFNNFEREQWKKMILRLWSGPRFYPKTVPVQKVVRGG